MHGRHDTELPDILQGEKKITKFIILTVIVNYSIDRTRSLHSPGKKLNAYGGQVQELARDLDPDYCVPCSSFLLFDPTHRAKYSNTKQYTWLTCS